MPGIFSGCKVYSLVCAVGPNRYPLQRLLFGCDVHSDDCATCLQSAMQNPFHHFSPVWSMIMIILNDYFIIYDYLKKKIQVLFLRV